MAQPKYLAMHLPVVGKKWTIYFCSKRYFDNRHRLAFETDSGGTLAFVVPDDKAMYLLPSRMKRETIMHELTHAYLWELCLNDLYLSEDSAEKLDRLEEAFCDMMAKYGKTMIGQLDQIQAAYSILRGRAEVGTAA